jgi:hypothetical protein
MVRWMYLSKTVAQGAINWSRRGAACQSESGPERN